MQGFCWRIRKLSVSGHSSKKQALNFILLPCCSEDFCMSLLLYPQKIKCLCYLWSCRNFPKIEEIIIYLATDVSMKLKLTMV